MSVKPICMWKPGELSHLEVTKTENGFVVCTGTVGPILQPDCSGRVKVEREQICKSYPEVLELLAEYFAWDTLEAAPDEPANASGMGEARSKFPDTFVRFDASSGHVRAVFREWTEERSFDYSQLANRIEKLHRELGLGADERQPWDALLKELDHRVACHRRPNASALPLGREPSANEGAGICPVKPPNPARAAAFDIRRAATVAAKEAATRTGI